MTLKLGNVALSAEGHFPSSSFAPFSKACCSELLPHLPQPPGFLSVPDFQINLVLCWWFQKKPFQVFSLVFAVSQWGRCSGRDSPGCCLWEERCWQNVLIWYAVLNCFSRLFQILLKAWGDEAVMRLFKKLREWGAVLHITDHSCSGSVSATALSPFSAAT